MGLRAFLEKYFPKRKGTRKVSWRDSEEFFMDEKASKLDRVRKKEKEHKQETKSQVEQLGKGIEAFNNYEDSQDLQIVEDVSQNFYRSRKRLIENFKPSEDMEEHLEDLQDFLDKFNDVSRKEGEVMKHVKDDSRELSNALEEIIQHREDMEAFVETDYQVVLQLETVREFVEKINDLELELQEAKKDLEGKDTRDISKDIEEIKEKLDEIEETEEWKHRKTLEREQKELQKKRKQKKKEIKSKISEMDRGLTKMLYSIENEALEFGGRKEVLEGLKNRETDPVEDPRPELQEALEKVREENILEGKDLEKFRKGVEGLENFVEMKNEVSKLEKELEDVEEDLEDMDISKKKEELKDRKRNLEQDLEEKKDDVRVLEEERNEKDLDFDRKTLELQNFLNSVMRGKVKIEELEDGEKE